MEAEKPKSLYFTPQTYEKVAPLSYVPPSAVQSFSPVQPDVSKPPPELVDVETPYAQESYVPLARPAYEANKHYAHAPSAPCETPVNVPHVDRITVGARILNPDPPSFWNRMTSMFSARKPVASVNDLPNSVKCRTNPGTLLEAYGSELIGCCIDRNLTAKDFRIAGYTSQQMQALFSLNELIDHMGLVKSDLLQHEWSLVSFAAAFHENWYTLARRLNIGLKDIVASPNKSRVTDTMLNNLKLSQEDWIKFGLDFDTVVAYDLSPAITRELFNINTWADVRKVLRPTTKQLDALDSWSDAHVVFTDYKPSSEAKTRFNSSKI